MRTGGAEVKPFLDSPLDERAAMFSPDGRWVVYAVKQPGRTEEVYVQPYPATGGKWLISSSNGGMEPVWSPTGREIYYRTPDGRRVMVVTVSSDTTFAASTPRPVFEGQFTVGPGGFWSNYDISRDGREFLMLKPEQTEDSTRVTMVVNWVAELRRVAPH